MMVTVATQPQNVEKPQKPLSAHIDSFALLVLAAVGMAGLYLFRHSQHLSGWDIFSLVGLGTIGICRWSWFFVRMVRARIYLHGMFRRWRGLADRIPTADLPPMCFVVPTYKEQSWITERVFQAIAAEARSLTQPITLLVNSSGDAENDAIRAVLEADDPNYTQYIRLIQMTQKDGKRKAMADALRYLATLDLPHDTVIALMDGDSELAPGTLRQCLPFFRLFPRMGALTTDELPVVKGSYLFSEWFHLRFAQRHYQMCSDSLSRRVMCLTGRFSLFRSEAALQPTFADQLENDTLDDWLWGRFKFLSGDDKSTWFWLLRHGYTMLYIPDAMVYSIETLSGSVIDRAYQNMRRWYGNMLRNNGRAIAIGPRKIGWFTWYSLIDQRISIWTSLLTPGFLLIAIFQGNWRAAGLILSWVLCSRILMLWLVFWGRDSYVKLIHFPILLITQWSSSLVKIWTQMNLAKQNWSNRGNQSISAEGTGMTRKLKLGTSRLLLCCQLFVFGLLLCWLTGIVSPIWDLAGVWLNQQVASKPTVPMIEVGNYRTVSTSPAIIPNDGQDDAKALQVLFDGLPSDQPVQIQLPIGELDLFQPLEIRRSNFILKGQGVARTILNAHFEPSSQQAVLMIRPPASVPAAKLVSYKPETPMQSSPTQSTLQNIQIGNFSIRQPIANGGSTLRSPVSGILLEDVKDSVIRNLSAGQHPLILHRTQDVLLEYVTLDDTLKDGGIVQYNTRNTQTRGLVLPASSS